MIVDIFEFKQEVNITTLPILSKPKVAHSHVLIQAENIQISEYSPHYVLDPLHAPISCGLSATCKRPEQFLNHVTALISEQFVESWLDDSSFAKLGRSILQNAKAKALYLMVLYGILLYCRLFCVFYGIVIWYCMILQGTDRTCIVLYSIV